MGRLGLAFRVFYRILSDAIFAREAALVLRGEQMLKISETDAGKPLEPAPAKIKTPATPATKTPAPPKAATRSDALNLLAALQREGRFVDFLKEPLSEFSDAQIGAVVRDVHRDCAAVIQRIFGVEAVVTGEEGSAVAIPVGFEAGRFRLTGNVTGQPPYQGTLCHHGWEATRCEMPEWTGTAAAALVIAAAEVELK